MSTHRLLENEAFDPEAIQIISAALDDALHELRLIHRNDPLVQLVARRIIIFAQLGEHDPVKLRKLAVKSFGENLKE
jgi:hypothetical protein